MQNDCTQGLVPEGGKIIPVINKLAKKFKLAGAKIVASKDWYPENHSCFAASHRQPDGKPYPDCMARIRGNLRWKKHCVQETEGARLHDELFRELAEEDARVFESRFKSKEEYRKYEQAIISHLDYVVHKSTDVDSGSPSIFRNKKGKPNAVLDRDTWQPTFVSIESALEQDAITTLFLTGLALDHCVKKTAIHALQLKKKGGKLPLFDKVYIVMNATKAVDPSAIKKTLEELGNLAKTVGDVSRLDFINSRDISTSLGKQQ